MSDEVYVCSICGGNEDSEFELSVMHRGCRLAAWARKKDPNSVKPLGGGLISIDVKALVEKDEPDAGGEG